MKTFGLFLFFWIMSFLASFNIWKDVPTDELIKAVLATQLAFIMYKLVKEEDKE
ncbi:MAG: hypothetical protein ACOVNU_04100 [Candidatus Kapaibacteriota bacterium]